MQVAPIMKTFHIEQLKPELKLSLMIKVFTLVSLAFSMVIWDLAID